MKKLLKLTVSAVLVFGLAACSSGTSNQGSAQGSGKTPSAPEVPKDTSEDDAKAVVDQFWTAMEKGDVAAAKELTTGEAEEKVAELSDSLGDSSEIFGETEVSDEVKEKMNQMVRKMFEISFKDHSIKSVEKVSDTKFNILTNIKFIDGDMMSEAMESDEYNNFMTTLMTDAIAYSESHTEEEAMNYLYEKMIDYMIGMFDDLKDKVDYNDQEASFVVEKQDKGWIITEFVPNTEAEEEEE